MRVVLTCNFSPWSAYRGGGQLSTHHLATALSMQGHEVHVVFTKAPSEQVAVPDALAYALHWAPFWGLSSRRQAPLRPLNALGVARVVQRLCAGLRGSVIHSQGEEGVLIPRAVPNAPWLLTPRYPSYPKALMQQAPSYTQLARLWLLDTKYMLLRQHAHRARFVCPTSQAAADMVQRTLQLEPHVLRVVPNGVEPLFLGAQRTPPAASAPIVFFGRMERSKGVDVLLEAYARLASPPPLQLIGSGDYVHAAERIARTLGPRAHVTITPWLAPSELARVLSQARCVVLPSREESFGNAMVESMAAGVPLVTTRIGALPEVTQGGTLALLAAPGDVGDLAGKLLETLADSDAAEARAARARAHVGARYAWEASARAFATLYEEALASPARAV